MAGRAFILGIDGLSWRVLDPYIAQGWLPTFARLRDRGAAGVLESTVPPITPPAWASMLTGKNPGRHGLWNFVHPRRAADGWHFDLQTRFDYAARPLWRLLGELGSRGVFYNVPFAFPLDRQVGDSVLVSGFMTPDADAPFATPAAVAATLRAGGYREAFEVPHDPASATRITALKLTTAARLARTEPWQVFFMVVDEPDRLQHTHWPAIMAGDPACVAYYQALDRGVGELAAALAPDDVLWIVSDHGFRDVSEAICINDYLREAGLLDVARPGALRRRAWRAAAVDLTRRSRLLDGLLGRLRGGVAAFDPLDTGQHAADVPIDWARTAAFGVLSSGGCAVVRTDDDPEHGERLAAAMARLCATSAGRCRAYPRAELFHGPYADACPDWLIVADAPLTFLASMHGTVRRRLRPSGVHERDGVVIVHGSEVPATRDVRLGIYDVVPSVLASLGLPIPADLDGAVVAPLAGATPARCWDPTTGATYDPAAAPRAGVAERLARL